MTVFLIGALLVLVVTVGLFFFRQFALEMAQDHLRSVAEIVRVSLTESMINGVIEHRQSFLQRLADIEGLESARVVRGPEVSRQFGKSATDETLADTLEQQVFATGTASFHLLETPATRLFRGTIPFVAHARGTPNCLECHQVPNGTVLGVITIRLSMDHLIRNALTTTGITTFFILVMGVVFTLLFRWQLSRVVRTAQGVEKIVARAKDGDFGGRLNDQGKDEIGRISNDLNSLMHRLHKDLGTISHDVSQLIRYELRGHTNLLTTTTEMVDILLDVAQFKQAVEEEHSVQDVYQRIRRTMKDQFWVTQLTIYEIAPHGDQLRRVPSGDDGETPKTNACQECHTEEHLGKTSLCHARHTASLVDASQETPYPPCAPSPDDMKGLARFCIPIVHSGTVGNVFQMDIKQENCELFRRLIPFILVYLRESASTVEAKRLLDMSRESALRDALTGLHNRRFLEEYAATLESTTLRHKTRLAVLLLDLDHFKSVNDTWGHDTGDRVLKLLAETLTHQVVRTSDMTIRFGGEEFLVILQEKKEDKGREADFGISMAERIRTAVAGLKIPVGDTLLRQTLSIGMAQFPSDGESVNAVIKRADLALYQAKAEGRNRVVVYSEPDPGAGKDA